MGVLSSAMMTPVVITVVSGTILTPILLKLVSGANHPGSWCGEATAVHTTRKTAQLEDTSQQLLDADAAMMRKNSNKAAKEGPFNFKSIIRHTKNRPALLP